MAIRLIDEYPTRVDPISTDYPHGKGRNKTAPDAVDGTPYDQKRFNDHEALFQSLWAAAGITPNNVVDTVPSNQTMDALVTVANGLIDVDVSGDQDVTLNYNQYRVAGIRLTGALAGNIDVIVPDTTRIYLILNETTGSFTATVKTATGTGVAVARGQLQIVLCDGTDVVDFISPGAVTKTSNEGAANLPVGTEAERPASPIQGQVRYNSEFGNFEGYGSGGWSGLGGATGGAGNPAFYENDRTITADYTITTGKNAMTAGPIEIQDGVTVTVPGNSTWVVVV